MSTRTRIPLAAVWALAGQAAWGQCEPQRVVSPAGWDTARFGGDVEVHDDVAVVSDPVDHTFCPVFECSSGAVQVFRRLEGRWELDETIYHSRISEYDSFGAAISMDGPDRFAASAPGEDVVGFETGALYVFEHDGTAWREVAEILPVEPEWNRGFGGTLVLQGDTLIAGQRNDACWVYRLRNGRWEFDQKVPAPPSVSFTWFADGLALNREWLAVGAPHDSQFAVRGGLVHLYRSNGAGFELVQTLVPPNPDKPGGFGTSVAVEEDRLVVGAPFLDSRFGAAFIYELIDGSWTLKEELRGAPVFSDFGAAVAIRGDSIVVGAPVEVDGAGYLFQRQPDESWRMATKLLPRDPPSGNFGASVATDGASVIVGAPNEPVGAGSSPGAAHIFDLGCLLCRADLDGDGELTFLDFLAFQTLFGAGDMTADFDGDGALTFFDFLAFQNEFMAGCS
jgi:hypothetical protein